MSAISSLSSLNSYRPTQGGTLPSAQQAQRGTTYGSAAPARGSSATNAGSAYCPTCGGNASRSASPSSSSYCPTCNRAGGSQSNISQPNNASSRLGSSAPAAAGRNTGQGQGGRTCVACAYQGR